MSVREQLDLDMLPDEAKREVKDFYEFLIMKYGKKMKEGMKV